MFIKVVDSFASGQFCKVGLPNQEIKANNNPMSPENPLPSSSSSSFSPPMMQDFKSEEYNNVITIPKDQTSISVPYPLNPKITSNGL
ncbi:hypothetical protein WICPIJ_001474 [Wickerhamomyces pijperi]|uniref:Uncharacterized protein n=1 Tax=Wickerhamomyces pijperi TaxID=599730 RepID=A0A9P8QD81_WICPI|nr:hypothetical protein WICPIJ_001474 [Wickerhamomyces pijperi]